MLKRYNKTPVSYLQEQLLAKHMCPKYDLVFNGATLQKPKFTFRVQVGEILQEGTGKNKQKAKQRAAANMLKALHLVESDSVEEEDEEEEEEENEDPIKNNHVGTLKEFCRSQSYPDPVYKLEESAGPPHCKIFKMVCFVSNICQDGVARTKKAAKHIAAEKMLQRLKQCVKEALPTKETVIIPEVTLTPEEISEKYKNVKASISQNVQNPLAFYRDHHNAYLNLHEQSPTLACLMDNRVTINDQNSVRLAEDIAKELKVKLSISTSLTSTDENKKLVLVSMALTPAISEIGGDYENAACKLLKTLLILSKTEVPLGFLAE